LMSPCGVENVPARAPVCGQVASTRNVNDNGRL
jgi:hypothetical protein